MSKSTVTCFVYIKTKLIGNKPAISSLSRKRSFCDVCRQRGRGGVKLPPGISRVLEHIAKKNSNGYPYIFGVTLYSSGTTDVIEHQCVLKIQDGSQITGRTNISETTACTVKIPTENLRYSTIANSQEVYIGVSKCGRRLKMAAETRSTYISKTIKGTVKICGCQ